MSRQGGQMKVRTGRLLLYLVVCLLGLSIRASEAKNMISGEQAANFKSRIISHVQQRESELGCRIGLAFKDKELPLEVGYRAEELFHAASTMKIPVMIEVFRQSEQGRFKMTDTLTVDPVFHSMIDDSTYVCDAYKYIQSRIGQPESILKLTEQMIVVSDNLATNLLITLCGPRRITATARALGATSTLVLRCVQDLKAYEAGISNRLSARDLLVLCEAIETERAASAESCAEMRRILLAQEHNSMIPADLPSGVRVAHKTGSIEGVRHDSAIVYAPFGTYYLTILTDGLKIPSESEPGDVGVRLVRELSRFVYDEREKLGGEKIQQ